MLIVRHHTPPFCVCTLTVTCAGGDGAGEFKEVSGTGMGEGDTQGAKVRQLANLLCLGVPDVAKDRHLDYLQLLPMQLISLLSVYRPSQAC
jgi:uncharacterized spore protein YtfJ